MRGLLFAERTALCAHVVLDERVKAPAPYRRPEQLRDVGAGLQQTRLRANALFHYVVAGTSFQCRSRTFNDPPQRIADRRFISPL